jgi:hypothetical protein
MPRLGIVALIALLLGGPPPASAQETGPASRAGDLGRLIERLDSDDFATREAATRDIAAIGESARAALIGARDQGSLERRIRIDQILRALAASTTSRPARREATFVTLEAVDKPLSEACALLSKESGYAIRIVPGADPTVTASLKHVPFFQALDALATQTGRRADWDLRERAVVLMPTPEKPGPSVYPGPLRVTLMTLNINRSIRFGGQPYNAANLQIRVDAEEKVRALGILVPLKPKELVDDQKRDLRVTEARSQITPYLQRMDQRAQTQGYMPMACPEPDAKAIGRLEVTISVVLTAEAYEARITNPEEGLESADGPLRVKIESWKAGTSGSTEVSLSIARPVLPAISGTNVPVQDDVVTFFGADGRTIGPIATANGAGIPSRGEAGAGATVSAITFTATLPAGAKVAGLEVSSPKRVEVLEVPVVFENVPLP